MKLAIIDRIDDLVTAAQRLQRILDTGRPDAHLPALLLYQLAFDVGDAVGKLERHAGRIGDQKGE